jgi:pyruvate/2-oxoglutarate dehydrogenase complex dihydrolipoamide acyltransferase (E2) component
VPVFASVWHVPVGGDVLRGESVLEVTAGDVTVDLPAPVNGTLIGCLVAEDESLHVGQVLAVIRCMAGT